MTKKTPTPEEALQIMKDKAAERGRIEKLLNDANEAVDDAAAVYRDSIKDQVYAVLRELTWSKPKGRGSRGFLEAALPKDSVLHTIIDSIETGSYRRDRTFGPITLDMRYLGWGGREQVVRASVEQLAKIGIVLKGKPKADRKKLVKLLNDAEISPEELKALLAKRKTK